MASPAPASEAQDVTQTAPIAAADNTAALGADFKQAMRRLAASVSVITAREEGEPRGIAATAVTSLTVDPPAMIVCVNQSASIHPALAIGAPICINLLHQQHSEVSGAFGGMIACDNKFDHGEWQDDERGIPYLVDAQSNIFATVEQMTPYGSHSIIIARVAGVRNRDDIAPLIFQNGGYL